MDDGTAAPATMIGASRALLRAISAGRGELLDRCGPLLRVDGCWCCDQLAIGRLVRAGLVEPPSGAAPEPARLTPAGRASLSAA
ncbi:MAG: hypothetical protein L0I76_08920 [Pseudonocardia sp.]|nr:hypothetical protein [Pseudonocardia sp.]